jgi:hypothetical protein
MLQYKILHIVLVNIWLKQTDLESCVHYKVNDKYFIFVLVYTDDMLILSSDKGKNEELKNAM